MSFKLSVTGFKEIDSVLKGMPNQLQDRVLKTAHADAAKPLINDTLGTITENSTINGALVGGATGAVSAGTGAALNGGDVGNAILVGGLAGAAGGAAYDLSGGGLGGQIAGQVANNIVGGVLVSGNPIYTPNPNPVATTNAGAASNLPVFTGVDPYASIINPNAGSALPSNYFTGGSTSSKMARQKTGLLGA